MDTATLLLHSTRYFGADTLHCSNESCSKATGVENRSQILSQVALSQHQRRVASHVNAICTRLLQILLNLVIILVLGPVGCT